MRAHALLIAVYVIASVVGIGWTQQLPSEGADPQKQTPTVKPGSKDDISAIGNRDVGGGRGIGNWYSLEREIAMGKEYAQQIEASVKFVQDPLIWNPSDLSAEKSDGYAFILNAANVRPATLLLI